MNLASPVLTRLPAACALALAFLMTGCASSGSKPSTQQRYDFGPVGPVAATPGAPVFGALVVADVTGPPALEEERMLYRLGYANPLEARSYGQNRWTNSPLDLVTQRVKARLAQSGNKVVSTRDAANGLPILRLELDEFVQHFDNVGSSRGLVTLRASLFSGHQLVDQRSFSRATPAPSADAAGGAYALAASTDGIAADLNTWLASLPVRR